MTEPIRYRIRMPRPHSHRFEVEARFPAHGETLTVALPVWTPGSYLVREFSRHLERVTASNDAGKALAVTRVDKRSFRVDTDGEAVTFRYSVYANELTVRTSHLDGSHGFLNGATVFLYDDERRGEEHRVAIEAPVGWRTFTALDEVDGEHIARDYDELVDSPFEIGPHEPIDFMASGVPHQLVVWGEPMPDRARLAADLQRICETEAALFGGPPRDLKRYLFLLHLVDRGRGGLEHASSSAMVYPRFGFSHPRGWEDFLNLVAHEYFHLWLVKRIRPATLVPYDYAQENYTKLLWFFEGGTSYYDMLLTRRAGLVPPHRYVMRLGEALTALQSTPGRRMQSLEEASLQAWIKHYRPDEHTPNSAISYYLKGELVCWLLDLQIRRATSDARSLDDLLRLLWDRYGRRPGQGVPEGGVEAAVQELTGQDLSWFFNRSVRSTEDLDLSVLSHVGLEARFRTKESATDKGGTPPRSRELRARGWLGVVVKASGTLSVVYEGSPAMNAGLYPDDEVIALDGFRVDGGALITRCEDKAPGERVVLTLFRRDRLLEVPVVLGTKQEDAVYLVRVDGATEAQKAAWSSWIGAPWQPNDD